MKKFLFITFLTFCQYTFSQSSVLETKPIDQLTKQDMYSLGQTYAEFTYKDDSGNIALGFFFGPLAKGVNSMLDKDAYQIQKIIKRHQKLPPKEVIFNRYFIEGFNRVRKDMAVHSMRKGEILSYAIVTFLLLKPVED